MELLAFYYRIVNCKYQVIRVNKYYTNEIYYSKVICMNRDLKSIWENEDPKFICENKEETMDEHEFKTYTELKNITDLDIPIPSDKIIYDELKNSKKSVYKNCEIRVEKFNLEYYTVTCVKTLISTITEGTCKYILSLDEFNERYVIRDKNSK